MSTYSEALQVISYAEDAVTEILERIRGEIAYVNPDEAHIESEQDLRERLQAGQGSNEFKEIGRLWTQLVTIRERFAERTQQQRLAGSAAAEAEALHNAQSERDEIEELERQFSKQ